MLKKKQLKYFKNLLNERLENLLKEANRTVSGMSDLKENMPDPADRATLESDRNFTLRIRDRERKLIGRSKMPWNESKTGHTVSVSHAKRIYPMRD